MKKEILINVAPHEKRIAILENQELAELIVERPDDRRIVGNVYKSRVTKVLPGLQSAFVDLGLERAGFLHISDVREGVPAFLDADEEDLEEVPPREGEARQGRPPARRDHRLPKIESLFREGQEILVQILKEPLSTKGPKVTNQITLPGRFLVLIPGVNVIGVSKKTRDLGDRRRLKTLIQRLRPPQMGVVVRTIGLKKTDKEFEAEIQELNEKWERIKKAAERQPTPSLLYEDRDLTSSTIRDVFSKDFGRVLVDNKAEYQAVTTYLKNTSPELLDRVYFYQERAPMFEVFGVEKEIDRLVRRKVWLKGGGYLIFDQTEAMAVIDVNTGRNVGKRDVEDTLLRNNLEAAEEIARQIRLRDLGGLLAIDFIDMKHAQNRRKLLETFDAALKRDRAPYKLGGMGEFGIVTLTRKRVREDLFMSFTEVCQACGGTGRITSKNSIIAKLDRQLHKVSHVLDIKKVLLDVNPLFHHTLAAEDRKILREMEKASGVKIKVTEDPALSVDSFHLWDESRQHEFTKVL